jgi:hypothetical protein
MQRPAKILLVGTSIATLGFAAGAANAQQAGAPNIQVSFGDVFAGQKLKVIDPADGIALTTAANAAAVEVEAEGQDARLDSYQQSRSVRARTTLTSTAGPPRSTPPRPRSETARTPRSGTATTPPPPTRW